MHLRSINSGVSTWFSARLRRQRVPVDVAVQSAVVVLVLTMALFTPRPGNAVLLIPLTHQAVAGGAMLEQNGLRLVGVGPISGALIGHPTRDWSVWRAIRHGMMPIAVPDRLCGQASSNRYIAKQKTISERVQ